MISKEEVDVQGDTICVVPLPSPSGNPSSTANLWESEFPLSRRRLWVSMDHISKSQELLDGVRKAGAETLGPMQGTFHLLGGRL